MDPHWDYLPPPPYDRMFTDDPVPPIRDILHIGRKFVPQPARERVKAAYAGEVRYADSCVGRLLESLGKSQRGSNTIIVLTSGHGESFWERGLAGHANNLHEEEIRVPLIIRTPDHPKAGAVVTGQVGLIDLAPTLLDLAGVKAPLDWEGVSLKPFLAGGAAPDRPVVLDNRASGTHVRGVRTSGYKIIAQTPFEAPLEAYDLVADPGETNNLIATGGIPLGATELLLPLLR